MAEAGKKEDGKKEKNWYADRYQFVVVQRNILALITLLALLCSIAATFSISQLVPLKSVEPLVIQVDQKTGLTQVVDPLTSHELTANESINQYFIVQYVRARESFVGSYDRNLYNLNMVRVLSDPPIYNQYGREVAPSNPESPSARMGGLGGTRDVVIGSIKFLDKNHLDTGEETRRYLVKVQIREHISDTDRKLQKLILIEFKYAELELKTEERYLNPIGFRVLSYRVDEDNLTQ